LRLLASQEGLFSRDLVSYEIPNLYSNHEATIVAQLVSLQVYSSEGSGLDLSSCH